MAKCRWSKSDTLTVHAPSTARLNLGSWGVHIVRQWGQCVTYKFDTHDQAINYKIAYLADQRITGQQPILDPEHNYRRGRLSSNYLPSSLYDFRIDWSLCQ